jgi:L-asparagine transporter-like permease
MLLFWAVLLFCIVVNTVISSLLPKFEGLILILHIVGFFAVLIPMVRLGTPTDAHTVFTTFNNGGHWPNSGLSFFVGLTGNAFAFLGK